MSMEDVWSACFSSSFDLPISSNFIGVLAYFPPTCRVFDLENEFLIFEVSPREIFPAVPRLLIV